VELSKRNDKIDIARGLAILFVVFSHTISNFLDGSNTVLYNVIFSIQMPLFMIISGYVCMYSKPITGLKSFFVRIWKRTYSLLLPFAVWTLLRYVAVCDSQSFVGFILDVFYHTESWYWFLVSLWCINLLFAIASLISFWLSKGKETLFVILQIVFLVILFVLLAVIGKVVGLQTLAIKLTLYYLPFFCLGYYVNRFGRKFLSNHLLSKIINIGIVVVFVVYSILITRYSVIGMPDTLRWIALRVLISLLGCLIVFYVVNALKQSKIPKLLGFVGKNSLELYVVHYFFLNLLSCTNLSIFSGQGTITLILNFAICLIFSGLIIYIIKLNKYSNAIFFGKF